MKKFKSKLGNPKQSFLFYEGDYLKLLKITVLFFACFTIAHEITANIISSDLTSNSSFEFSLNFIENFMTNRIKDTPKTNYSVMILVASCIGLIKFTKLLSIFKYDIEKESKRDYIFWSGLCILFAGLMFSKYFLPIIFPVINLFYNIVDFIENIHDDFISIAKEENHNFLVSKKWSDFFGGFIYIKQFICLINTILTQVQIQIIMFVFISHFPITSTPEKSIFPFLLTYKRNERPPPRRWFFV